MTVCMPADDLPFCIKEYNFNLSTALENEGSFDSSGVRPPNCYIIILMENIEVNDRVILRKTHPCGGCEWTVVRIGADIGLECLTCGHKIFLSRRDLARRIKGEPIKQNTQNLPK